jgi:hypothetical protein
MILESTFFTQDISEFGTSVLWIRIQIRIRKDPKLFAGSGSGFGFETGLKSY